jgi:hypothetical protein
MRQEKSFKAILLAFLICGLVVPGFSMYVGNYSGSSFDDTGKLSGPTEMTATASGTVEDLVIKSATYFLKGKAYVDLLASRLEAAEIDGACFNDYQTIVNDALDNMRMARYYYQSLKNKADITLYNQVVISKLRAFDYQSFMIENGLISDMFNQVRTYLVAGDVRGAYGRFLAYIDDIINILETVQKYVYCWNFPKAATMWKLNQECAKMLLFGQYMAQVFYKISD